MPVTTPVFHLSQSSIFWVVVQAKCQKKRTTLITLKSYRKFMWLAFRDASKVFRNLYEKNIISVSPDVSTEKNISNPYLILRKRTSSKLQFLLNDGENNINGLQ